MSLLNTSVVLEIWIKLSKYLVKSWKRQILSRIIKESDIFWKHEGVESLLEIWRKKIHIETIEQVKHFLASLLNKVFYLGPGLNISKIESLIEKGIIHVGLWLHIYIISPCQAKPIYAFICRAFIVLKRIFFKAICYVLNVNYIFCALVLWKNVFYWVKKRRLFGGVIICMNRFSFQTLEAFVITLIQFRSWFSLYNIFNEFHL